jgi:TrmH RNA methyltransferase
MRHQSAKSRTSRPRSGERTLSAPPREAGELTYGLRAGLAVIARRPNDIVRIAHSAEVRHELASLQKLAGPGRFPIEIVSDAELGRMAGSSHHEGLCVWARPRHWASTREVSNLLEQTRGFAIALDRVRNPYNVGAILRSAAFFGVPAAILGAIAPHPALATDAVRVAEGGAEHLMLSRSTDLADTLGRFRQKGVHVVGADGASRISAIGYLFPRPLVLVLGHEREGISERVRAHCDTLIAIPGSGAIESLNVAVAAGLLLGEVLRKPR